MGGQGLLLLMELKVLIMMTRLQNITRQATVMFCGLVIIIKTFNSINSRRPWPPILISHLFQHGLFLNSWPQLFLHQGCFGWDFIFENRINPLNLKNIVTQLYSSCVYMCVSEMWTLNGSCYITYVYEMTCKLGTNYICTKLLSYAT